MRNAIKRIFRGRKAKKKKGQGSRETTDDTTQDEAGDQKPVSWFQPGGQRAYKDPSASLTAASSLNDHQPQQNSIEQNNNKFSDSISSNTSGRYSDRRSTKTSSIISPIREEFDQVSESFHQSSPPQSKTVLSPNNLKKEELAIMASSQINESSALVDDIGSEEDIVRNDMPMGIANNYESIPVMEQTKLPRGGVSVETQAVGRVQVCSFRIIYF